MGDAKGDKSRKGRTYSWQPVLFSALCSLPGPGWVGSIDVCSSYKELMGNPPVAGLREGDHQAYKTASVFYDEAAAMV